MRAAAPKPNPSLLDPHGTRFEVLEALLRGTTDAVYTKDLEGRYLSINPAGAQYLGHPEDEILGKTDLELMESKEEARATFARERAVMLSGETVTFEVTEGPPGAARVWLSTKGALRDATGKVFGLFGISRDITERKRIEQRLQVNEERLRLCIEAAQLATWDWDLEANAIRWSANSARVMGVPQAELESSPTALLKRIHPEDRDAMRRVVGKSLRAKGDQVIEFRLEEPGAAAPRWFRGQGHSLWRDDKPVRALGVVMDISAQKQAEEELRRNAVFQDQLIGIVSHDIRSPVSAIIGWAHMLQDQKGEEAVDSADRIISSARRIERLTRRLLDLTEARMGRGIPVSFQAMNLHEVTERIVDEVRAGNPRRVINLALSGNGDGSWDPDRMGQVVSNLLENALKYSPADSAVSVFVQGDGQWIELKVHNGGKPIHPDLLPYVFEPFRRGLQAPGAPRSLGLGLYIVRELVESHGGQIHVRSTEADGTTFTVRLPQRPAEQAT